MKGNKFVNMVLRAFWPTTENMVDQKVKVEVERARELAKKKLPPSTLSTVHSITERIAG